MTEGVWVGNDAPWGNYPIGTKARESWHGGYWTKVRKNGWQWLGGSTFPTPGAANQVCLPKESKCQRRETNFPLDLLRQLSFYRITHPLAKKSHVCVICQSNIAAGKRYLRIRGKKDLTEKIVNLAMCSRIRTEK